MTATMWPLLGVAVVGVGLVAVTGTGAWMQRRRDRWSLAERFRDITELINTPKGEQ